MANINAGNVTRWESGGTFSIIDGATTHTVLNIQPGSIKITPGGYEKLRSIDRGVQKQSILGNAELSTIEVTCRIGAGVLDNANEILTLSTADDTTNGLAKEYSVEFFLPSGPYLTSGSKWTFANTQFEKPAELSVGTDFDTLTLRFVSRDRVGTLAAVP